jgi:hypothetical protein
MSEIEKPFAQGVDKGQSSTLDSTGRQIVMIFDDVHCDDVHWFTSVGGVGEQRLHGVLHDLLNNSGLMISHMVTETGRITLHVRFRTEDHKGLGYFDVPQGDLVGPALKRADWADPAMARLKANPVESSARWRLVMVRFIRRLFGFEGDGQSSREVASPSELDISEQVEAATKSGLKDALKVPTYFPRD